MKYQIKLFAKINFPIFLIAVLLFSVASRADISQADSTQKSYAPYPQPDRGYVTDIAGVLSSQQQEKIESWLYTTEYRNGTEIAIVIINSINDYPGTANTSIESFATGLFNAYGIGNMPKNNGVLLVVAIRDRAARIELGAYYGRNRDSDADRIMQKIIIPHFKKNDYAGGIMAGAKSLIYEFAGIWIISGWIKLAVLFLIIALIPVCISLFLNGKRGWGWICVGFIIILLLLFLQLLSRTVKSLPADAGAGGYGGGFGGGFSGGGGATGHW